MWIVVGEAVSTKLLGDFQPKEVIDFCDFPRSFLFESPDGTQHLAYWCDSDGNFDRYVAVPCKNATATSLLHGDLPIRFVLDQPIKWIVDVGSSGIERLWRNVPHIPGDYLPDPTARFEPAAIPQKS